MKHDKLKKSKTIKIIEIILSFSIENNGKISNVDLSKFSIEWNRFSLFALEI